MKHLKFCSLRLVCGTVQVTADTWNRHCKEIIQSTGVENLWTNGMVVDGVEDASPKMLRDQNVNFASA